MKKIIALVMTLALLVSMTACIASAPSSTPTAPGTTGTTGSTPSADTTITLTDQAGRTVTLAKPAQTIVSCYYITTYACMALGIADRIVGLEKKADSRPIYHMAAPQLLQLPNVGSLKEFNVEAAASLKPELVIMPMKLQQHADTLSNLGIAVLVVDPETQEGLETMLTLIAKACGVEEKADSLLNYYETQLTRVAELTKGATKPTVYLGSNSSYLETAPGPMYQSNIIDLAGGVNVAGMLETSYWTEVSYETILTWNPDVIIVPCGASYSVEDIMNDANLANTNAVKNHAVYQMPKNIEEWDSPVPSGILGILWMTSVLHEAAYPYATFQADVVSYYQTYYGFTIDTNIITK